MERFFRSAYRSIPAFPKRNIEVVMDISRGEKDNKSMAQSKAELQREIQQLRKKLREHEELLQQAAIKCEQLQGVFDATVMTGKTVRENFRKAQLSRATQRN
jgi:translation initiation factor 2B subunit (eIF-2B alpha/beta/delta family)